MVSEPVAGGGRETSELIERSLQRRLVDRLLLAQGLDRDGRATGSLKNGLELCEADRIALSRRTHQALLTARREGASIDAIARNADFADARSLRKLRLAPDAKRHEHLTVRFGPHFRLARSVAAARGVELEPFLLSWLEGTRLLADAAGSQEPPDALAWVVDVLREGGTRVIEALDLLRISMIVDGNFHHITAAGIAPIEGFAGWLDAVWPPRVPLFHVPSLPEVFAQQGGGSSEPWMVSLALDWDRAGSAVEPCLRLDAVSNDGASRSLLSPLSVASVAALLGDGLLFDGPGHTWTSAPITCGGTLSGGLSRGPDSAIPHILGVLETGLRGRMEQGICIEMGIDALMAAVAGRPAWWPGDDAIGPLEHLWLGAAYSAAAILTAYRRIEAVAEEERMEVLHRLRTGQPKERRE